VGFECCYHYHEKIDGEYNKDELKTFKKKVGDPFDDVPLERLAAAIMAQLARRDVWIVDVEVYELSKKQVNFKESKGGIVIKNKKFLFDSDNDSTFISVEDAPSEPNQNQYNITEFQPTQQVLPHNATNTLSVSSSVPPHNLLRQNRKPIDQMVYVPEPQQLHEARVKNLRLTVNRRYPVYEKRPSKNGVGEVFLIQDDVGKDQLVSDAYFVPARVNLIADAELGFSQSKEERDGGTLYWGNASNDPGMPDVRRR